MEFGAHCMNLYSFYMVQKTTQVAKTGNGGSPEHWKPHKKAFKNTDKLNRYQFHIDEIG